MSSRILVWDLPLRLFHWALLLLVCFSFVSAKIGGSAMLWHGRSGLAILALLVFRIVWGFIGARHARFSSFVKGPAVIRAYLRGEWQGVGHNPLGALSVLALLGVLSLQAFSGLFANDDIAYTGYLAERVSNDLASTLTSLHHLLEKALLLLLALHVAAIFYYTRIKKQDLLRPMLTGMATGRPDQASQGGRGGALIIAILIAIFAVLLASGQLLPDLAPATPASQLPNW